MSISETLKERGSRYGEMEDNAELTQELMAVIKSRGKTTDEWTRMHWECVHMIMHKISRMACGDTRYADNPHDICGYAKLLEEYLEKLNGK